MGRYRRLPKNDSLKNITKALRKNMTPWERKLWYEFLSDYSIKFTRQKNIGDFIVDFHCAKAKLVVELDGSQHYSFGKKSFDSERTYILEQFGLTVLRFSNNEVTENFYGVCSEIDKKVKELLSTS